MKRNCFIFCTVLVVLSALVAPKKGHASADTVFVLSLDINMTKAVQSGIFNPSLDRLYAVFDTLLGDQQLVNAGDNKFTLNIGQGLDSGSIYHFRFRINNFITESVNRQVQIEQGVNYYSCWWNDDYLNYTWFQVDMSYLVQNHTFRPDTDYVDIVGSMNNFQGSPPLSRIGTGYVYQIMYNIEPGTNAAFKFRINGDTSLMELKGKPNRFLLAPDSVLHSTYWFNNYNPARVPMTFYCNMKYMTRAGHFSRQDDHVDVAGSFNGNGAYDILYDYDRDSIYTATVLIDTAFYQQNPITFKYRINSSWATAELEGQPSRSYFLHDTASGRNIDSSWYNNWNPAVPAPPMALNVGIQGNYIYKQVITGLYSYENINGISEGLSTYQWYRSTDSLGINITPIDTAINITFTVDTLSIHQWLVFEVTPIASSGDSAIGEPVRVVTKTRVGYTGIGEKSNLIATVYPNPSNEKLVVEAFAEIRRIEIYDLTGRNVFSSGSFGSNRSVLDPGKLTRGIYILKALGRNGETGWARIVRN